MDKAFRKLLTSKFIAAECYRKNKYNNGFTVTEKPTKPKYSWIETAQSNALSGGSFVFIIMFTHSAFPPQINACMHIIVCSRKKNSLVVHG